MNKGSDIPWKEIDPLLDRALREDLGDIGDLTTDCTIPEDLQGRGEFIVRENGIVAGLFVVGRLFEKIDEQLTCTYHASDGSEVTLGDVLCVVEGSVSSILKTERTALNFIQRLSGIATLTQRFVSAVEGTGVKILDTRKTTPQFRWLEKYAVRQGGGENHRFGLFDMVLIKDNHIDACGGITPAIERCIARLKEKGQDVKIEVECRTLDDVREASRLPVHRVMLDNMNTETMRRAVEIVNRRMEVEASGTVSLENVRTVAETGVDYISVGALTHSYRSLDISLLIR